MVVARSFLLHITKCAVPAASGRPPLCTSTGRLKGSVDSADLTRQLYGYWTVHCKVQNSCSLSHCHRKKKIHLSCSASEQWLTRPWMMLNWFCNVRWTNVTERTLSCYGICSLTRPVSGSCYTCFHGTRVASWRCRCPVGRFGFQDVCSSSHPEHGQLDNPVWGRWHL